MTDGAPRLRGFLGWATLLVSGLISACDEPETRTTCIASSDCSGATDRCLDGRCVANANLFLDAGSRADGQGRLGCGNGRVDPGETCDGDCPTSCPSEDLCTLGALSGSAETCDAECTYRAAPQIDAQLSGGWFGGDSSDVFATSIVRVSDGYIIGGYFSRTTTFFGRELRTSEPETNAIDSFVAKFGLDDALVWFRPIGGLGNEVIEDLRPRPSGGFLVAGYFSNELRVGAEMHMSRGSNDIFLLALSDAGQVEWLRRYGGETNENPKHLAVDAMGRGYVTFVLRTTFTEAGATVTSQGAEDIGLLGFQPGGAIRWVRSIGSPERDDAHDIHVTPAGEVLVGISHRDEVVIETQSFAIEGGLDGALVAYDLEGELQWIQRLFGPGNDRIMAMATDPNDGRTVVTGEFTQSSTLGGVALTGMDGGDIVVFELGADGEPSHIQTAGSPGTERFYDLVIAEDGTRYFAGITTESLCGLPYEGRRTLFVAEAAPRGGFRWFHGGNGTGRVLASGVAVVDGKVRVSGYFDGAVDFGIGAVASMMNSNDGFLLTIPRPVPSQTLPERPNQ